LANTSPAGIGRTMPKFGDLRKRAMFLLMALVVYRLGTHIPVPGIDPEQFAQFFRNQQNGILGMFNMFSGGALSRFTVFALGVMPYISASIVLQLMTMVAPQLEALKKEGQAGQRKITQYTRYFTVVIAAFQAFFIAIGLERQQGLVTEPGAMFYLTTVITLVTGTMFLMWLGEQVTERGLGNGISIIIFGGIAASFPNSFSQLFSLVNGGTIGSFSAILIIALIVGVTYLVVFIERGQRKVLLNYAKRQVGNKIYGGTSSHLPLKLNMSGVIPPIFASSIILLPATLMNLGGQQPGTNYSWLSNMLHAIGLALRPGEPVYMLLYAVAVVFFAFFYTAITFNSKEVADNLKKSGAFVPGIRPGDQTSRYIDRILTRLTLAGAFYLVFVCLLPEFIAVKWGISLSFGGTSLMIAVVVTMDFMAQVQSYVMSQQYESLLKKANFKGGNFPMVH